MRTLIKLFLIVAFIITAANGLDAQTNKDRENTFQVAEGENLRATVQGFAGRLYLKKARGTQQEGRVTAYYDPDKFDYDFFYDEKYHELFVTLDKESNRAILKNIEEDDAELDVFLPTGVSTDLEVEIKAGELDVDLSGLTLTNFELSSWAGVTEVRFRESNPVEMEFLRIDVNIGEVDLSGIGYANFKEAEIDGGIGQLIVDLEGEYTDGDHYMVIDLDIGEARITLPKDIGIRMSVSKPPLIGHVDVTSRMDKKGKYYYSEDFDDSLVKLYLKVKMGIGECTIR